MSFSSNTEDGSGQHQEMDAKIKIGMQDLILVDKKIGEASHFGRKKEQELYTLSSDDSSDSDNEQSNKLFGKSNMTASSNSKSITSQKQPPVISIVIDSSDSESDHEILVDDKSKEDKTVTLSSKPITLQYQQPKALIALDLSSDSDWDVVNEVVEKPKIDEITSINSQTIMPQNQQSEVPFNLDLVDLNDTYSSEVHQKALDDFGESEHSLRLDNSDHSLCMGNQKTLIYDEVQKENKDGKSTLASIDGDKETDSSEHAKSNRDHEVSQAILAALIMKTKDKNGAFEELSHLYKQSFSIDVEQGVQSSDFADVSQVDKTVGVTSCLERDSNDIAFKKTHLDKINEIPSDELLKENGKEAQSKQNKQKSLNLAALASTDQSSQQQKLGNKESEIVHNALNFASSQKAGFSQQTFSKFENVEKSSVISSVSFDKPESLQPNLNQHESNSSSSILVKSQQNQPILDGPKEKEHPFRKKIIVFLRNAFNRKSQFELSQVRKDIEREINEKLGLTKCKEIFGIQLNSFTEAINSLDQFCIKKVNGTSYVVLNDDHLPTDDDEK